MEKDNVYVLFEEIKNKIEMINGKLEQKTETPTDGQAEEVIPTCVKVAVLINFLNLYNWNTVFKDLVSFHCLQRQVPYTYHPSILPCALQDCL